MIKVSNIIYPIASKVTNDALLAFSKDYFCQKYHIKQEEIKDCFLYHKSVDARIKHPLAYHLAIVLSLSKKSEDYLVKKNKDITSISEQTPKEYVQSLLPKKKQSKNILVVGSGPSGLFACDVLNLAGMNVTLIERGDDIQTRSEKVNHFLATGELDETSNVQFGMGGAGTFSDGKLNTGIKSPFIRYVLSRFVDFGANPDILFDAKPHIGTDVLQKVLQNMQQDFLQRNIRIRFLCQLTDLQEENSKVKVVLQEQGIQKEEIYDDVFLAIGHSAHDTYRMLEPKLSMEPKPFSMGVRIEHLQKEINQVQYHGQDANLVADYKLVVHLPNGRSVYTFCMCPGGEVVNASSEKGYLVCNGMSNNKRDGINANSALLVNVNVEDYYETSPLDGLHFQEKWEHLAYLSTHNYKMPVTLVKDFLQRKPSTSLGIVKPTVKPGYEFVSFSSFLPDFVYDSLVMALPKLNQELAGFNCPDAVLTGLESRSSAPVRLLRNENYCSSMNHVYPIGEGSGYAGGIMTSAIDGIKASLAVLEEEK
jgi:uncharacterized FAD-dependent dehydrogenase